MAERGVFSRHPSGTGRPLRPHCGHCAIFTRTAHPYAILISYLR